MNKNITRIANFIFVLLMPLVVFSQELSEPVDLHEQVFGEPAHSREFLIANSPVVSITMSGDNLDTAKLIFYKDSKGKYFLTYVTMDGKAIPVKKLNDLAKVSFTDNLRLLKIETNSDRCPGLISRIEKFFSFQMSTYVSENIYFPGGIIRVWIVGVFEEKYLSLRFPSQASYSYSGEKMPTDFELSKWVLETVGVFKKTKKLRDFCSES